MDNEAAFGDDGIWQRFETNLAISPQLLPSATLIKTSFSAAPTRHRSIADCRSTSRQPYPSGRRKGPGRHTYRRSRLDASCSEVPSTLPFQVGLATVRMRRPLPSKSARNWIIHLSNRTGCITLSGLLDMASTRAQRAPGSGPKAR
jgi:hypothetical protein